MLNDQLTGRIAAADRSFQRQSGLKAALHALKYCFGLLLLLFAIDLVLQLGAGSRLALGLFFITALLGFGAWIFYLAQIRRNRPEHSARLLESRDPTLGSRLINFLQLRQLLAQPAPPDLTRTLAERAVAEYTAALQSRDFTPLTKSPTFRRDLRHAAFATGALLILLGAMYPVSTLEFLRFLDPFGDHPAYSFTQIEIVDPADDLLVDYNGRAIIKARTSGHRPDDLFLRFHDPDQPGEVKTLPMYNKGELGFMQAIEGVKTNLLVVASTKNGRSLSKSRRIRVGLVPKIERAFVQITPPAYTGIVPHEAKMDFKSVTALAGSEIKFRLQSNRPLASGTIAVAGSPSATMQPTGENEVSGSITASESARLEFAVVDPLGHISQETRSAPLTVTHDLPPEIAIDAPAQDGYVCDDFVVEARISARDDYGLKTIRIHRALNETFSAPKVTAFAEITRHAGEALKFDIKKLGVRPGDIIAFFAEAIDTCPEAHLVRTPTRRLTVISTEDYNSYLRERSDISDIQSKYADLLNEFHDRVDEQRALTEEIHALQEKAKDPAAAKDIGEQLDKLMAKQAELNKKLSSLAEKMENFVREKPLYDLESELQKALTEKAHEIRSSVAENDQALKEKMEEAAKSMTPQQQADALATLGEQSQRQADDLQPRQQQLAEETMPPLKDAALMNALINDFNAIKYLHETQTTVAAETRAFANRPNPTEEDRLALKQLASTEKTIQWALDRVVENLRRHAEAAEEAFPKAAESARHLAETVETERLSALAGRTANTMLTGNGGESSALADRLREELDALFEENGEGRAGGMQPEFDQYLKLKRGLSAGKTFGQMSQSQKFGLGQGNSQNAGNGEGGQGGLDGFATSSGGTFGLFGNETLGGDPKSAGQGSGGQATPSGPGQKVDVNTTDSVAAAATNRLSGSTQSESAIDEYRGVIDAYFNSITK